MRDWTLSEFVTVIEDDLNLHEENFISPNELKAIINFAIDKAEALIHTLYEDYFLDSDTLTLVSGTASYDLPTDIYANKLRQVMYNVEDSEYEIKHMRSGKALARLHLIQEDEDYRYIIKNGASTGRQMVLYPTPAESGAYVTRWYIRNAKTLVEDTDVCDIPEFASYVIELAKGRCMAKENGGQIPPDQKELIKEQEMLMIETLTAMVPDGETLIEKDTSHYEDSV